MVESALADMLTYNIIHNSNETSGQSPVKTVRSEIDNICRELLPEVIGLTDAFGFTDWELDRCVRL